MNDILICVHACLPRRNTVVYGKESKPERKSDYSNINARSVINSTAVRRPARSHMVRLYGDGSFYSADSGRGHTKRRRRGSND